MWNDIQTSVKLSGRYEADLLRTRVVMIGMLLALAFLAVVLWRVQVVHASQYRSDLERQSIRRVRLPGTRGAIYDRNGICLADNRPSYCIAVYVEELRRPGRWHATVEAVQEVLGQVGAELGLEAALDDDAIRAHIRRRLPLPLLVWRDIGTATLARWAERRQPFPGVDLYIEPVRHYPRGPLAAHVVGYVGSLDIERDPANPYHYYLPEMEGKVGIEEVRNDVLAGSTGGRLIRVDASGFKHDEVGEREPGRGEDIYLTLDARLQEAVEDALAGEVGAVVVMDPRNGDVLAMASSPDFDPNVFSPRVSSEDWQRLTDDPRRPLYNRAAAGAYPPGSTFKPLVAIAALENRQASGSTTFDCPGFFALGNVRFHCWRRSGHGTIGMRKAIEQSCNAYFCQLGLATGHERIYHMADAVGFGHKTGVAVDFEVPGLLPGDEWKRRHRHDAWRSGDTCNLSIGQGALLATPLQMAMFTAALANGGRIYRPRLLLESGTPQPIADLAWSRGTLEIVRGGMLDVVEAETGTGKRARVEGMRMGGKTGTAEYGPRDARKKHAWMIAFGPFEAPRYAVAVVIEDAMSGGRNAAPRIRAIIRRALDIEEEDRVKMRGDRA